MSSGAASCGRCCRFSRECRLVTAAWRQPNRLEVVWNPVNRWVKTREDEAPAEPPNAGPRCERLPAILRSSGDRRSPRGRDAAQQELRPPGTPLLQESQGHWAADCGQKDAADSPTTPSPALQVPCTFRPLRALVAGHRPTSFPRCLRLRGLSPAIVQSLRFLGTLRFVTILPSSQPPLLHARRRARGDCPRCHTK